MIDTVETSDADSRSVRSAFPLAVLTACATFPLILLGGLVTTYEVGMAVPDAPTTFGHNMLLYPVVEWLRAPLGVFLEHGHRLFGALVGFFTLLLAAAFWSARTRRWVPWLAAGLIAIAFVAVFFRAANPTSPREVGNGVAAAASSSTRSATMLLVGVLTCLIAVFGIVRDRFQIRRWLGVLALGLVIVQGGLGALRVAVNAPSIAAVHGVVAQGFFAFMVCLATIESRRWRGATAKVKSLDAGKLQRLAAIATSLVCLQLIFGATLRHLGFQWTLVAHLVVAFLILIHVGLLAKAILTRFGDDARLVFGIEIIALLVAAQLMLGAGAWATSSGFGTATAPPNGSQVFFATAHVAVGSLILAGLATLTAASFQFFARERGIEPRAGRDRAASGRRESAGTRPTVSALESRELFMVGGAA